MSIGSFFNAFHLRKFNRNVHLFFGYGIAINAGMALFTLLYNLYLLRLSYQEDFIGQVAGMAPLATGLFALPIGMLSDRFGRKPFSLFPVYYWPSPSWVCVFRQMRFSS